MLHVEIVFEHIFKKGKARTRKGMYFTEEFSDISKYNETHFK